MAAVDWEVRRATVDDAAEIARLLHDFNVEFATPSPGADVLEARLRTLLAAPTTFAILAGVPAHAVALVTLRTNVWYDGAVALLDEMYVVPERRGEGIGSAVLEQMLKVAIDIGVDLVEINVDEIDVDAQRFYRRHGFSGNEAPAERAFYFFRELTGGDDPA
jgi:GNAT superfamily N-acetyltransferase